MTLDQGILLSAIGTLSGVVVYLFRKMEKSEADCKKGLDECEEDRLKLWQHIYKLEGRTCGVLNCDLRKVSPPEIPTGTLPRPEPA